MAQPSTHKLRKRVERQQRVRRDRHRRQQRRAYHEAFPAWTIEPGPAPQRLVSLVEAAVRSLRLDDTTVFTARDKQLLRVTKRCGFGRASLTAAPEVLSLLFKVGQALYARMHGPAFERLLLDCDVRVFPLGNTLQARCYSLLRHAGPGGTIYYSPRLPAVSIGGRSYTVGFTRHAVEQVYERLVPSWRTFEGHSDAFQFIYGSTSFEPCELAGSRPAVTFFADARPGCWAREYVRRVVGPEPADSRQAYAFRVGYFPVALHGRFAVAKTLLLPGYKSTPEHALLRGWSAGRDPDGRLRQSAFNLSAAYLMATGDFSALRFYHEHGVPQVVPVDRPLVDPAVAWELPR